MKILLLTAFMSLIGTMNAQTESKMKMNAGIITAKIKESKEFYSNVLDFGVTFESDFYLLMHTPDNTAEISFLKPNHPSQQPMFQKVFAGKGIYLTIEVDDVNEYYQTIKAKNIEIVLDIREEAWGDTHFAILDPNGIGIDIVSYTKPEE